MQVPLQVHFRGFEASPALEELVRDRALELERFNSGIIACRVVVEQPNHHHAKGDDVQVRIEITFPGHDVVVQRADDPDPEVSVRCAFDVARRRLQDETKRMRGEIKRHVLVNRTGPRAPRAPGRTGASR